MKKAIYKVIIELKIEDIRIKDDIIIRNLFMDIGIDFDIKTVVN